MLFGLNHGKLFSVLDKSPNTDNLLASYDKITLATTANKEKEAMIDINGALFGGKAGSTTVLADDYGTVYCSDLITSGAGVTTISKATSGITRNVITLTDDRTLTMPQGHSLTTLRLPPNSLELQ